MSDKHKHIQIQLQMSYPACDQYVAEDILDFLSEHFQDFFNQNCSDGDDRVTLRTIKVSTYTDESEVDEDNLKLCMGWFSRIADKAKTRKNGDGVPMTPEETLNELAAYAKDARDYINTHCLSKTVEL